MDMNEECGMNNLTGERNHEPSQQGVWFPYTGFRYKDSYDIQYVEDKTNEVKIATHCYPNAMSFSCKEGVFKDKNVLNVRLNLDTELPIHSAIGQERIDEQLRLFMGL